MNSSAKSAAHLPPYSICLIPDSIRWEGAMRPIELERRFSAHNYDPLPVVLARGHGAHLFDVRGRRYIDMMSAYSAASHGHAHPRILAALTQQAGRLAVPSRAYYNDRLEIGRASCRQGGLDWRVVVAVRTLR